LQKAQVRTHIVIDDKLMADDMADDMASGDFKTPKRGGRRALAPAQAKEALCGVVGRARHFVLGRLRRGLGTWPQ